MANEMILINGANIFLLINKEDISSLICNKEDLSITILNKRGESLWAMFNSVEQRDLILAEIAREFRK